ncbi:alpha/beta hydrolase-fold protein [Xanthocytophaga agilis]|uniref:Alpha/beta hydrolase-fold protein n=1 Tax=Xanthocytophaga agilis TaxID=3048010 RepID=A0AAE3UDK3_9BACT|nr:alpha/beta hydrolase-fold protein [Xanthocytophaga agilis]MDJ1499277.1 alpha/beta hydrolase-fold protein [Xanthocytophaga agilis]
MGILVVYLLLSQPAFAQLVSEKPSPFIEKEIVNWDYHSKQVNDDFTIYIHFPPGYDTSKISYPVLYMTDGDWNMTVAMNCFNMLRQDYTTTEPLIVGIGYGNRPNKRSRDLNPSTGGPAFLKFITDEVMPFVKSTYRITDNKALYGYSLGGMFTTYVLFTYPELFNMIFIGAPGNNGNELLAPAQKYFASHTDLKSKVFVGVGSYEHETTANIEKFKAYLLKQNCKQLDLETAITPNAGHGAALAQVMQNAIAFAYCKKYKPIAVPAKTLQKYAGTYILESEPNEKYTVFVQNEKLYFKSGQSPTQLVPYTKNGFFMYENQKGTFTFKEETGKMSVVYEETNQKPTSLKKIN